MDFYEKTSNILGTAQLQIEGFFTERVINLCRIQNIKVWNIINITSGIVRFDISIKDVKKLKHIVKKTKCKMKIIKKRGIYFTAFRYRKRKLVIPLIIIVIILINIFNRMIWNVEVVGNDTIDTQYILDNAKESGIYKGKFKFRLDNNYAIKLMKKQMPEIAWIGLEYKGTTAYIKIVEKTSIPEEIIYDKSKYGNIVANKSGVITKVVAENGTAVHKVGSYVEEGMTLIDGVMHSEILGDYPVRASGQVRMDIEYIFEKEYKYNVIKKEYLDKLRYTIGFSLNDNEICLNYLNKNKKYDTLKSSKTFNLFNNVVSIDLYTFNEYNEIDVIYSYDELVNLANEEKNEYINTLLDENSQIVSDDAQITITEDGIVYKTIIVINEKVGIFKGE